MAAYKKETLGFSFSLHTEHRALAPTYLPSPKEVKSKLELTGNGGDKIFFG